MSAQSARSTAWMQVSRDWSSCWHPQRNGIGGTRLMSTDEVGGKRHVQSTSPEVTVRTHATL